MPNDHRKPKGYQFVGVRSLDSETLFGDAVTVSLKPQTWRINDEAFLCEKSYLGVIDHRHSNEV